MVFQFDTLLEKLHQVYPNILPMEEISGFEQGKLVGSQEVIDFIETLIEKESDANTRQQDS